MRWVWLVLAGCGRLSFDPLDDGGPNNGPRDGTAPNQGVASPDGALVAGAWQHHVLSATEISQLAGM